MIMKSKVGFLLCIVSFSFLAVKDSCAQDKTFPPEKVPGLVFTPSSGDQPLVNHVTPVRIVGKRASQYTADDWGKVIDATWGPGQGATTQLQIFDTFWNMIDQQWGGFLNLPLNLDSLRTLYRPQIGSGLSRGRFYALMSQMWLSLQEFHTVVVDVKVDTTFGPLPAFFQLRSSHYKPGVPLLCLGTMWLDLLGAPVTALPDSTGLVYRAAPGNPLGLKPGDIILGYEGVRWKQLYRQLLDNGVPVSRFWSFPGSTPEAQSQLALSSVGWNWGLFDTVDIVKYSTGDTIHLPTALLASLSQTVYASDQVPVPGVSMPPWVNGAGPSVSYGVVQGTNVGYIYVWDWWSDATLFYDAIYDLRYNKKVDGLILDFRMNYGGNVTEANPGLALLFGSDPTSNMRGAVRSSTEDHSSFSFYSVASLGFTPTADPFSRPIAVLIGPGCVSAGDYNAFRMRFRPNTRSFGKPTNGAFVANTHPGGTLVPDWVYQLYTGCIYSNVPGEGYFIHKGVQPDEEVWLTRDGVAQGQDDVVNRALAWIKTTGVAEGKPQLPSRFTLSQNYPNPFNPSTTIKFELPKASHVSLTVFDILGQQVSVLVNEKRNAGVHEVKFDGTGLASGVYVYRIQAGGFSATRRMAMVR
jgi:hypothetical protein